MGDMNPNSTPGNENSTPTPRISRSKPPLPNLSGRGVAISEPKRKSYLGSIPLGKKQEASSSVQILRRPKTNTIQEELLKQQQHVQQLLQDDESKKLEARLEQQRQQQQQKMQNPGTFQNRLNQLTQLSTTPSYWPQPIDDAKCTRRLTHYLVNLRSRPKDNNIEYWRSFVSEFYADSAKERWCLSAHSNNEAPALGPFYFPSLVPWCCEICGTKSGKGFEVDEQTLPRLFQMRFGSNEVDQILQLESHRAHRLQEGAIMLEYGKAAMETRYEQSRISTEGKLRITFRPDLKILSWEFCALRHEEFLSRQWVNPQVNQFIEAANKYQNCIYDWALGKVIQQDVQRTGLLYQKSGQQLSKAVELSMLNDLGFSAKHSRGLEIAKVVNVMKDMIDFSIEKKVGAIESLKSFPRPGNKASVGEKMQVEPEAHGNIEKNVPADADDSAKNSSLGGNIQEDDPKQKDAEADDDDDFETLATIFCLDDNLEDILLDENNTSGGGEGAASQPSQLGNGGSSNQVSQAEEEANMEFSFEALLADAHGTGLMDAVESQDQLPVDLDPKTSGSQPHSAMFMALPSNSGGFGNASSSPNVAETS